MLTFTVAQQGRKSGGTQLDRSVIIVQHQLFLRGNGSMLVVPVPGQGKYSQSWRSVAHNLQWSA